MPVKCFEIRELLETVVLLTQSDREAVFNQVAFRQPELVVQVRKELLVCMVSQMVSKDGRLFKEPSKDRFLVYHIGTNRAGVTYGTIHAFDIAYAVIHIRGSY